MTELARLVGELLDPFKGVERGLLDEDSASLLINIRAGELRKIGVCLRLVQSELLSDQSSREPVRANNAPGSDNGD